MMNGNKNHELPKAQTKNLNGVKTNGPVEIEDYDPKSKNGEIKVVPVKNVSNANIKPNISSNAGPPVQTFENAPFKELMSQYEGVHHKIQPTIELQQALLMSTNFKEGAGIVNGT